MTIEFSKIAADRNDHISEAAKRPCAQIDVVQLLKDYLKDHPTGNSRACIKDPSDGFIHCGPIVGTPAPDAVGPSKQSDPPVHEHIPLRPQEPIEINPPKPDFTPLQPQEPQEPFYLEQNHDSYQNR